MTSLFHHFFSEMSFRKLFCLAAAFLTPNVSAQTFQCNTLNSPHGIFVHGDVARIECKGQGFTANTETTVSVSVRDENRQIVSFAEHPVRSNGSGEAFYESIQPASRLGYYELSISHAGNELIAARGSRPSGFTPWIVVPSPSLRPKLEVEQARFGMNGGFSAEAETRHLLGIRWQLGHLGWHRTEPEGPLKWQTGSRYAPTAFNRTSLLRTSTGPWQTFLLPTLIEANLPAWARLQGTEGSSCQKFGALNGAGTARMPGMVNDAIKQFVAEHAAIETPLIQVTWEPANDWCYRGTTAQLVDMYRLAKQGAASSGVPVMLGGPTLFSSMDSPNQNQVRDLIAAGLAEYLDAVAVHAYARPDDLPHRFLLGLRTQWWAFNNAAQQHLPLWATEQGFRDDIHGGVLNTSRQNISQTIMLLGEGARLVLAFHIHDFKSPGTPVEPYGYFYNLSQAVSFGSSMLAPKPAAGAFAAMTFLLEGATSGGPIKLHSDVTSYIFERHNKQTLVLWANQNSNQILEVPTQEVDVTLFDWMGNPVTTIPAHQPIRLTATPQPSYLVGQKKLMGLEPSRWRAVPLEGNLPVALEPALTWNNVLNSWRVDLDDQTTTSGARTSHEGCFREFLAVTPAGRSVFTVRCASGVLSHPASGNRAVLRQHSTARRSGKVPKSELWIMVPETISSDSESPQHDVPLHSITIPLNR